MLPVVLVVVGVLVVVALVLLVIRRPRKDDGVSSFRRHIDALSPEARREVQERARRHDEDQR